MNNSVSDLVKNEIKYGIESFSSLGSYPVYLLIIIFLLKIEYYTDSLRLIIAFILMYLLGLPIRANLFRNRKNPKHHSKVYENSTSIKYSSFPSFHATRTTILALLILSIYQYSLDSILLMITILILVCYSRILLQKHYLSDVYGGISFGIIIWGLSYLITGVII